MEFQTHTHKTKQLSVFALVMINVIAVDSLRSLTAGSEFGFSLVFFYLLAGFIFFLPTILVSAELSTGWSETGGVYIWVREAFGPRIGLLAIWLQWIYNVVWYPTIFAFVAGIVAYLVNPELIHSKTYMLSFILISYWSVTILNCLGLKVSSLISIVGATIGTIFPMIFIAVLGIVWLVLGKPTHIQFTRDAFFPGHMSWQNIAFLTNILFGLIGMEMSAVHAGDVKNPKKDYPKALAYSAVIILTTLIFASLAIAIVIPTEKLNLVSGLIDAFHLFLNAYQLGFLTPILAVLIVLGGLSCAAAWIIGPARGLQVAGLDNSFPRFFEWVNRHNMPAGILITQGVIVTFLSLIFLIMPSVNSTYWVLSNLTAQLALIFYLLFFAAAIRLRYSHPAIQRTFKIPGKNIGIWLVSGVGMATCVIAIMVGFIPPAQFSVGKLFIYESILIGGIIICCALPFLFKR